MVRDNDVRFNPGGVELDGSSATTWSRTTTPAAPPAAASRSAGSLRNRIIDNTVDRHRCDGISVVGDGASTPEGDAARTATSSSATPRTATRATASRRRAAGHTVDRRTWPTTTPRGASTRPWRAPSTAAATSPTATASPSSARRGLRAGYAGRHRCTGPDRAGHVDHLALRRTRAAAWPASAFAFTGTDNVAPPDALRFECRLDAPPDPDPAPDPATRRSRRTSRTGRSAPARSAYHFLFAGVHTFEVRAIDPGGNFDLTPATYTWTVAPMPPGPDTDAAEHDHLPAPGPGQHQSGRRSSVSAAATTPTPGPNLRYECRLDGGGLRRRASARRRTPGWPRRRTPSRCARSTWPATSTRRRPRTPGPSRPAPADTTPPDTTDRLRPGRDARSAPTRHVHLLVDRGRLDVRVLAGRRGVRPVHLAAGATSGSGRPTTSSGSGPPTRRATPIRRRPRTAGPSGRRRCRCTVSCGQTLTQSILLTNDLTNCPDDGLVVGAAGITVDLNGFGIDGIGLGVGIRNNGLRLGDRHQRHGAGVRLRRAAQRRYAPATSSPT